MAKKTYLQAIQEALQMRDAGRQQAVERSIAGVSPDFVGPTQTPPASTPEQQAAQAIARSRILAQQAQQLMPPSLEQLNLKPKDVGKMSGNTKSLLTSTMLGEPEKAAIMGRLGASQQEAGAAQAQMGLDEATKKKIDEGIIKQTLGGLSGLPPEEFLNQAPGVIGQAGAKTGQPSLVESAVGMMGTAARSRAELTAEHDAQAGDKYLSDVYSSIKDNPELLTDPNLMINTVGVHAYISRDTSKLLQVSNAITGNRQYAEQQAERQKVLQRELDRYDQTERESILKGTLDMSNAFMPLGTDFNFGMGLALKTHGKTLEDLDPEFASSLKALEGPLVKMNELKGKIDAEKTLNGQWDRLNEEYSKTFDKDGKLIGPFASLKGNIPGLPMADGSKASLKEFVLFNFQKRLTDLMGGGAAGGSMDDQLQQLAPGLLKLNETVTKQLEEERAKRKAASDVKNEGAYRAIAGASTTKPVQTPSGGSLRQ